MTQKFSKQERQLLQEYERRTARIQATDCPAIDRPLLGFDRQVSKIQKAFIDDPSRFVMVSSGRRAGKTFAIIIKMLNVVLSRKNSTCWYVVQARGRVKDIFWPTLKRINDQYKLGAKFNDSDLTATFPTGGVIKARGVEDVYHANAFRGFPALLYCVDEAAFFRDKVLEYLLDDVIYSAMQDYPESQVLLAGSPGSISAGYFYKADRRNNAKSKWSSYHWTVLDNEFYDLWAGDADWREQAKEHLAKVREEKGWSETNNTYLREQLGQWNTSNSTFYYDFNPTKNIIAQADVPEELTYVLGLDIGVRKDATALSVLGWNEELNRNCYVVDTLKIEAPTTMDRICGAIKMFCDLYKPVEVVGDYAGAGTLVFQEIANRYGVLIKDAQKRQKAVTTDIMNSEMTEGRFLVSERQVDLISELQTVQWDEAYKKPADIFENDLSDATQYGFSEVFNYLFKPKPPPKTEAELIKAEIDDFFQREDEKIHQSNLDQDVWGIRTP